MNCWTCRSNSGEQRISPGPPIYEGRFWIVEHAYPTQLLGWLVIVLRRHAEALHELTRDEFLELASIQYDVLTELYAALHCPKEYLACYAELEHFQHIHFHVVPKPADLPGNLAGSASFGLLKVAENEAVPRDTVKRFCEDLRDRLELCDVRLSEVKPATLSRQPPSSPPVD
jgi:diadenosine tetraphosphate (Ap4A) HIT family hydrolase